MVLGDPSLQRAPGCGILDVLDQEGIAKSSGKASMADRELMLRQASDLVLVLRRRCLFWLMQWRIKWRIPSQLMSACFNSHGMSWYVMVCHGMSWSSIGNLQDLMFHHFHHFRQETLRNFEIRNNINR